MQIVVSMAIVVASVAAPYWVVMAMRKASHSVVAAAALAVPTGIALARVHAYGTAGNGLTSGFDALILAAALVATGVAAFVRVSQAALGERASSRDAFIALNLLGIATAAIIVQVAGKLEAGWHLATP